jgi:hypothetical protein
MQDIYGIKIALRILENTFEGNGTTHYLALGRQNV